MRKLTNYINGFNIINILIILLYYFKSTRKFIKTIIEALLSKEIAISLNTRYIEILPFLKYIMYIYIIVLIGYFISRIIQYYSNRKYQRNNIHEANEIDKELYNYINNDERKCFVITGDWGVGKTYTVDHFFDKYYKYENRNIYRISCFGMENRTDVLNELKNIFEKQDKSIKKHIINLLNKIPIIGDLLEETLKSDYEFKDLKEKSIFVFDDFERINIPKYDNIHIRDLYQIKNLENDHRDRSQLRNIYKEFESIEKAFKQYSNTLEKVVDDSRLQRYNVIVGIINELIERYNMKVIVICNKKEIDNTFFNDIFECKIESIFYKINSNSKISYKLADRNINNRIYIEKDIKDKLNLFFKENSKSIDTIWEKNNIQNVRILSKSISAFIDLIENCNIDGKYFKDLFFTILLTHIAIFLRQTSDIKFIQKGELIKSFYEKHKIMLGEENDLKIDKVLYSIASETELYDVRWMGLDIGSAWSVGIHSYEDVKGELAEYDQYNYIDEYKMFYLNEDIKLEEDKTYKFDDLAYLLKVNYDNEEKVNNILKIIKEGEIDCFAHTSYRLGGRIFADVYGKENITKTENIFSIIIAYDLDNVIITKLFESLGDNINIKEINGGMKRIEVIKEKYIKYCEENICKI